MPPNINPQTVADAARGDVQALRQVFGVVKPLVLYRCRTDFGTEQRERADEVAKAVCRQVMLALPAYEKRPLKYLPFVVETIGRRLDRERPKRGKRAQATPSPHEKLIRILPAGERDVLVLRVMAGLSADQAAEALGRTPNIVRLDQHRAVKRLRECLRTGADQIPAPTRPDGDGYLPASS